MQNKHTNDQIQKHFKDFQIIKDIGQGAFGLVKLIKKKSDGQLFALKILSKHHLIQNKQVQNFYEESQIIKHLNCPLIVKFHKITQSREFIFIQMDYIEGGELFECIQYFHRLNFNLTIFYTAQIVQMIEYLHSEDIVYRDLKPENLILTKEGNLKMVDFGISKRINKRSFTLCGTPDYLAPEIILQKGHGKPVDWWCLGIILYEMLTGFCPFSGENPIDLYQQILFEEIQFPRKISSKSKSLIKKLLKKDLSKRIGNFSRESQDIKEHRFFKDFDWGQSQSLELEPPYKPNFEKQECQIDESIEIQKIQSLDDPFLNMEF